MASNTMSSQLVKKTLDFILRDVPIDMKPDIYVALMTTRPNIDGTGGVEVSTSGTGYKRQRIPRSATSFTSTGSGGGLEFSNLQKIEFPKPLKNWGSVVSVCLFDQETNGELLWVGSGLARQINAEDSSPIIEVGQLRFLIATC